MQGWRLPLRRVWPPRFRAGEVDAHAHLAIGVPGGDAVAGELVSSHLEDQRRPRPGEVPPPALAVGELDVDRRSGFGAPETDDDPDGLAGPAPLVGEDARPWPPICRGQAAQRSTIGITTLLT